MVMIPIVALGALAVAFLVFLSYQVWWQSGNAGEIETLAPVDLEAFRNLMDPEEVRFLRANLSSKEFNRVQRARLRAADGYICVISENASRLVALGRSGSSHPNGEVAVAALDVVHRAWELKVWCSLSRLKLKATMLCPTLLSPSSGIAERYLDVTSLTAALPKKLAA